MVVFEKSYSNKLEMTSLLGEAGQGCEEELELDKFIIEKFKETKV